MFATQQFLSASYSASDELLSLDLLHSKSALSCTTVSHRYLSAICHSDVTALFAETALCQSSPTVCNCQLQRITRSSNSRINKFK